MNRQFVVYGSLGIISLHLLQSCENPTDSESRVPAVVTAVVSEVTCHAAVCGGKIKSDGGEDIIARGVCWSTSQYTDLSDSKTVDGFGAGSFTSNLTDLTAGITYYVRAYATNSIGTGYSDAVKFTTKIATEFGTVTDIDGNIYLTVKLANQWWMAENLKVTHYRNGDEIPNVTDNNQWASLTTDARCAQNNSADKVATYGYLYNWCAVNDVRNIAPPGWHVPTDAEWQNLANFLGGNAVAGGKLKESGTAHWNKPNTEATNASDFCALAGGYRDNLGNFSGTGGSATFWSSTEENVSYGRCWEITYNSGALSNLANRKSRGFSVRLVAD